MKKLHLLLIFVSITLDQWTKAWAFGYTSNGNFTIKITDFLNITSAWNRGVSFGMFNQPGSASTILLWLTASLCLFLFFWFLRTKNSILSLSLSCIIGGAVGNLIDRLRHGAVYDYIDVHAFGIHFWTFNIADASITIGACLILWDMAWVELKRKK